MTVMTVTAEIRSLGNSTKKAVILLTMKALFEEILKGCCYCKFLLQQCTVDRYFYTEEIILEF